MSQSTLQDSGTPGLRVPVEALRRLLGWLSALDKILRGEATRPSALREQSLRIPTAGLSLLICGLALFYGFCMGMYPGCRTDDPSPLRWLACTVKIPALFSLTLAVTFPSLYVVNALVGSRLQLPAVWQLLVASLGVNLAVLASAGPIVAFFSFSTTNWAFMILLNVLVFAVSGLLGMRFLLQTLHRMSAARGKIPLDRGERGEAVLQPRSTRSDEVSATASQLGPHVGPEQGAAGALPPSADGQARGETKGRADQPSFFSERWSGDEGEKFLSASGTRPRGEEHDNPFALDSLEGQVLGRHVKTVFCTWTVIFGVVGAQMAWVLRPYFGSPHDAFVWFGPRTSNFFEGVWSALRQLL